MMEPLYEGKSTDEASSPTRSSLSLTEDVSKMVDVEAALGCPESSKIAAGEEHNHPNIVSWDSPSDPANPQNWSSWFRWTLIVLMASEQTIIGLAVLSTALVVPLMMKEFHNDDQVLKTLTITIWVLGGAIGSLISAPLSEFYGRLFMHHTNNVGSLVSISILTQVSNVETAIGIMFMCGVFGGGMAANGGGVIADAVRQERRGRAVAVFTLGLFIPILFGPLFGSLLGARWGWRDVYKAILLIYAILTLIAFVLWRESYPPVILARKAARLRAQTGNPHLHSTYDDNLRFSALLKRSTLRAAKMLIFSHLVLSMSMYAGVSYSYYWLSITTIPSIFATTYGFTLNMQGTASIGFGIGYITGAIVFSIASDRILQALTARAGDGDLKPERRLPLLLVSGCCIPIGCLWFGWSVYAHTHWIVPSAGLFVFGFGGSCLWLSIQAYLIDSTPLFAASAAAAVVFTRSIMATVIPLASHKLYASLGLGWGNTLLAALALACISIPWAALKYGEEIRKRDEAWMKNL